MKRFAGLLIATLLCGGAVAASQPAEAHHAFASEYDIDKPITLDGTVSKIEWINPHSWIYVAVLDHKTNKETDWSIEFGSVNALLRRGLRKTDFAVGQKVTVKGYLAKNGRPIANASAVTLQDGRNFLTGSSAGNTTVGG